jgi:hypothetical protein
MALHEPVSTEHSETPMLMALRAIAERSGAYTLLGQRGREAHWFWRWKFKLADRAVQFDPAKFGWGWTDATASWVVPTALAVVALELAPPTTESRRRIALGKAMLLDRMCNGGGWNAGNPVVCGVALQPHLDTTAVALLGLQDRLETVAASLEWMLSKAAKCPSGYSLAWAILAARVAHAAGAVPAIEIEQLKRLLSLEIRDDPETLALCSLALSDRNPFVVPR